MSKKSRKAFNPQTPPAPKKTNWLAVAGIGALVVVLVSIVTVNKTNHTPPIATAPTVAQPTSYEFMKQGELRFISAKDVFITAIDIEIAQDDSRRMLGLMYREKMAENRGMLFVFNEEEIRSFWMKNTILSLDMIFVNAHNEIVTIHKYTKSYSEESYSSDKPASYVVEVNAGFADKYKLKVGDKITWTRN
ncbi:MAG: DUF192 domain-containing protein [Ignavibacteriales bacterium]|nr:DUF192 domain-containing protein [Ignavibacteriales bacterium]